MRGLRLPALKGNRDPLSTYAPSVPFPSFHRRDARREDLVAIWRECGARHGNCGLALMGPTPEYKTRQVGGHGTGQVLRAHRA